MKRSSILESRRKSVNPEIRESVDISFQIVEERHEAERPCPASWQERG